MKEDLGKMVLELSEKHNWNNNEITDIWCLISIIQTQLKEELVEKIKSI